MTPERWADVKSSILDRFTVTEEGQEPLDDRPGTVEFVEFTTPAGKFRLEFIDAARATGVATSSGRKMGTAGRITRTFSSDESVTRLDAYRWDGQDWQSIDTAAFA